MLRALVSLLLLVAVAVANDDCCSYEDRKAVLDAWTMVWSPGFSNRRVTVGMAIFTR